ncbi:hypothetical protein E2C01_018411 [Portunus trituberculatus]|uniref:Uncharacterized protein n=1 Tax=Portunus trituberculatus TaxID=210409 RepID=A0A5B7DVF3_PORTR|nr:hypothetical protein [Portunus trituberculatus]
MGWLSYDWTVRGVCASRALLLAASSALLAFQAKPSQYFLTRINRILNPHRTGFIGTDFAWEISPQAKLGPLVAASITNSKSPDC